MSTGERSAARRRRDRQAIWNDGDVGRASTSGLAGEISKAGPDALRRILVELGRRRGLRVMVADAPGARFAETDARHLDATSSSVDSPQVACTSLTSRLPRILLRDDPPRVPGPVTVPVTAPGQLSRRPDMHNIDALARHRKPLTAFCEPTAGGAPHRIRSLQVDINGSKNRKAG